MTGQEIVQALAALGWRQHAAAPAALLDFQRGWNLGPALQVDGIAGPNTQAALRDSLTRLRAGQPTASAHFSFSEFRCGCGGTLPGCRLIRLHRALLVGLEVYRFHAGPVAVASGYRCPEHNAKVGGATNSQHVYGAACDVPYALSTAAVAALREFSGIGQSASSHLVRHVDVRNVSGNNTTGGTPDRPTIWDYAQ